MTDPHDLRPALLRLAGGPGTLTAIMPATGPVIRARAVRRRRLRLVRRAAWCGAVAGGLVLARRAGRG